MTSIQYLANKKSFWAAIVITSLGFWLSSSLLLDFIIMPTLYVTGMMQENFSSTGYILFGIFNRIELICAAIILSATIVLRNNDDHKQHQRTILAAIILLGIALIYTYILTPLMGSISINLNLFNPDTVIPNEMQQMHIFYWLLEVMKISLGAIIINSSYHDLKIVGH